MLLCWLLPFPELFTCWIIPVRFKDYFWIKRKSSSYWGLSATVGRLLVLTEKMSQNAIKTVEEIVRKIVVATFMLVGGNKFAQFQFLGQACEFFFFIEMKNNWMIGWKMSTRLKWLTFELSTKNQSCWHSLEIGIKSIQESAQICNNFDCATWLSHFKRLKLSEHARNGYIGIGVLRVTPWLT